MLSATLHRQDTSVGFDLIRGEIDDIVMLFGSKCQHICVTRVPIQCRGWVLFIISDPTECEANKE